MLCEKLSQKIKKEILHPRTGHYQIHLYSKLVPPNNLKEFLINVKTFLGTPMNQLSMSLEDPSRTLYESGVMECNHRPGNTLSSCLCSFLALFLGLVHGFFPVNANTSSAISSLESGIDKIIFFFFSANLEVCETIFDGVDATRRSDRAERVFIPCSDGIGTSGALPSSFSFFVDAFLVLKFQILGFDCSA